MDLILLHNDIERFYKYHSSFLNNIKKNKIRETTLNKKKLLYLAKNFKKEIILELTKIKISKKYNYLLSISSNKVNKFLFDIYLTKTNYNSELFKFLLQLNSKINGNYQTQFLIRLILDNFKSELYFKVILYNYIIKVLYFEYAIYNDFEYFNLPRFIKKFKYFYKQNKKLFGNYYYVSGKILSSSSVVSHLFSRRKIDYQFKEGKDFYYTLKNKKKKLTINELIRCLSKCRFIDERKREYDFLKEDDLILLDYFYQKIRENYVGTYKWVNEFFLYTNTKSLFKKNKIKIFREYSPKLLKPQRLDIYFEYNKKKIAFEYQGEQHFKPIAFFGGREALKKRKRLDLKKEKICKKLNIILIKFYYNETVTIETILKKLNENNIIL